MRLNSLKFLLIATLVVALLPLMLPAEMANAAGSSKPTFLASCSTFNVIVAVSGGEDDGGGFDKFRYLVLDGNGKKLYQEDASRRIGTTVGSQVINFSYDNDGADGAPGANPIRFQVIDLDANSVPKSVLQDVTTNASCLPAVGGVTYPNNIRLNGFTKAVFLGDSQLYARPGADPLNITIPAGKEFYAFYRTADNAWVAVDVSGEALVWVAASTVSVDLNRIGIQPIRIDGADPAVPVTGGGVPTFVTPIPGGGVVGGPVVANALITTNLRFRLSPSVSGRYLLTIPRDSVVPVFGRNRTSTWIKVQYNDLIGWVSASFISLIDSNLQALPIVQ